EFIQWVRLRKKPLPFELMITGDETIEGTGADYLVRKIEEYKCDVVFVDGAYLFTNVPGVHNRHNEIEKLTALTRFFKRLAKTTKTRVVAVTQQNRQGEDKTGKIVGGGTT